MSAISTTHVFAPFDSSKSEPVSGQRLAKATYKQTADMTAKGEKARPSICVSIPPTQASDVKQDHYILLMPHIIAMIEDAQDGIVRQLYEAGKTEVRDDQLTIQAVAAFLTEQNSSKRLTKDSVIAWTEASGLADILRLRFAELLGVGEVPTPEQEAQVELQVRKYKESFGSLASPKTYFDLSVATNLYKALQIASLEDSISVAFAARLQDMIQNPKTADMMGL